MPETERTRILVWGAERVGDVVMTIPALKLLHAQFPDCHLVYVTTTYAREIVELTGLADEVRTHVLKGGLRNFFAWRKFRREVRGGLYDMIFLLGKSTRFVRKVAPIEQATGVFEPYVGHRVESSMNAVLRGLGLPPDTPIPSVEIDVPEGPGFVEAMAGRGLDVTKPYVVVHAGCNRVIRREDDARRGEKTWPEDNYPPLIEGIGADHPELTFVFVGTKEERRWLDEFIIAPLQGRVPTVDLCARTTIAELYDLLRRARLLISADSGVAHMCTMVPTPMVTMFGPTDEGWTGPFGVGDRALIIRAPGTTPDDKDSMARLTVEQVREAVEKQLAAFPARR